MFGKQVLSCYLPHPNGLDRVSWVAHRSKIQGNDKNLIGSVIVLFRVVVSVRIMVIVKVMVRVRVRVRVMARVRVRARLMLGLW